MPHRRIRTKCWHKCAYLAIAIIGKCVEDIVCFKVLRLQHGEASEFDLFVLERVHGMVLRMVQRLRVFGKTYDAESAGPALGVHYSEVRVAVHDNGWSGIFAEEAEMLHQVLSEEGTEIHHIGSTSIPGLLAKPIIDIAIGLKGGSFDEQLVACRKILAKCGYRYLGNRGRNGGQMFEKETGGVRTHAIQVHPSDSPGIDETLRFKKMLLDEIGLIREYSEIKAGLADLFPHRRLVYVWYKSHWLRDKLLDRESSHAWSRWLISAQVPSLRMILDRSFGRSDVR